MGSLPFHKHPEPSFETPSASHPVQKTWSPHFTPLESPAIYGADSEVPRSRAAGHLIL
jgi:hypothetical protein